MKSGLQIRIFIFFVLVVTLSLIHFIWDITSFFNSERLQVILKNAGIVSPFLYMLMMASAVVISPIPSLPLDIAAGAVFGPVMGTLYSVAGGLAGAVVSFLIARYLGRDMIERFLGGHINFCTQCSDKLLSKVVFISRLVPFISFDVVSYGTGLTKMSLRIFTIMTFLCMIPMTFVYNSFGAVFIIHKWISMVFGIILVVIFFILPRWLEKHKPRSLYKYLRHLLLSVMAALCLVSVMPIPSVGEEIFLHDDFNDLENWKPLFFPKIKKHSLYSIEKTGWRAI